MCMSIKHKSMAWASNGTMWTSCVRERVCVCVHQHRDYPESHSIKLPGEIQEKPQQRQTEARSGPPDCKESADGISKSVLLERENYRWETPNHERKCVHRTQESPQSASACPCHAFVFKKQSSFWILVNPLQLKLMTSQNLLALLHISLPHFLFQLPRSVTLLGKMEKWRAHTCNVLPQRDEQILQGCWSSNFSLMVSDTHT